MAQKQFLDLEGLKVLWGKIKSADNSIIDIIQNLDFSKVNDIKYVDGRIVLFADDEPIGEGFDASDFIVDGMLKDVEIVSASVSSPIFDKTEGKFIKFTWNVKDESGDLKVDYIAVSDLFDISGIESRLDELETKNESTESLLNDLQSELQNLSSGFADLQTEFESIKNKAYEDIDTDENGQFVSDSDNAIKASAVATALNELKSDLLSKIEDLTSVDFSNYYTIEQVDSKLAEKQDAMEAISEEQILELVDSENNGE